MTIGLLLFCRRPQKHLAGIAPKLPVMVMALQEGLKKAVMWATCAEVIVNSDKEVKVLRVTQAFECGAIVNPHHLENQAIGSIIHGSWRRIV